MRDEPSPEMLALFREWERSWDAIEDALHYLDVWATDEHAEKGVGREQVLNVMRGYLDMFDRLAVIDAEVRIARDDARTWAGHYYSLSHSYKRHGTRADARKLLLVALARLRTAAERYRPGGEATPLHDHG